MMNFKKQFIQSKFCSTQWSLIFCTATLMFSSCAVSWQTPKGYAEIFRSSDELRVLSADGLMMQARVEENEAPGGSQASMEFWTGNMDRSLRERGYHPVEARFEALGESSQTNDSLWVSTWIYQDQGVLKRYTLGVKVKKDELMILEASAIDTVFIKHQDKVMSFLKNTDFE